MRNKFCGITFVLDCKSLVYKRVAADDTYHFVSYALMDSFFSLIQ